MDFDLWRKLTTDSFHDYFDADWEMIEGYDYGETEHEVCYRECYINAYNLVYGWDIQPILKPFVNLNFDDGEMYER